MGMFFIAVAGMAAVAELLYTGKPSASALVLLFIILKVQADRAAYLFMKFGPTGKAPPSPWFKEPEPGEFVKPEEEEEEVRDDAVHVDSLGGKRKGHAHYGPRPDPAPRPKEQLRLAAPPPPAAPRARDAPKPKVKVWPSIFGLPRFHGEPHEVLGLSKDPTTHQILGAFRHWIKKHHPDHAHGPEEARQATDQARRLTEAKKTLLDRRKQRRAPPAA